MGFLLFDLQVQPEQITSKLLTVIKHSHSLIRLSPMHFLFEDRINRYSYLLTLQSLHSFFGESLFLQSFAWQQLKHSWPNTLLVSSEIFLLTFREFHPFMPADSQLYCMCIMFWVPKIWQLFTRGFLSIFINYNENMSVFGFSTGYLAI